VVWAGTAGAEVADATYDEDTSTPPSATAPRADEIRARKLAFMEREKIEPCGGWYPSRVPGLAMTEVAAHDAALEHDPAQVAAWIAEIALD
jgi:hypothetical protein